MVVASVVASTAATPHARRNLVRSRDRFIARNVTDQDIWLVFAKVEVVPHVDTSKTTLATVTKAVAGTKVATAVALPLPATGTSHTVETSSAAVETASVRKARTAKGHPLRILRVVRAHHGQK